MKRSFSAAGIRSFDRRGRMSLPEKGIGQEGVFSECRKRDKFAKRLLITTLRAPQAAFP